MKLEITITDAEVKALIADHLSCTLGCTVRAEDVSRKSTYGGDYVVGQYGGFEYPPIPKPATVPAEPTIPDSADASDKLLASPPAEPPF